MSTTAATEHDSPAEVVPLAAPESPATPTRPSVARPAADVARSSRRATTPRTTGAHASVVHAHSHHTPSRREPIRRPDPAPAPDPG